jgi:hypothetical protein
VEKTSTGIDIGVVLKGDQGWAWFGGPVTILDKKQVAEQQLFAYSLSLSNLLPLKEKGFALESGANVKIQGRDCYSFKVKSAGRPDMVLFLDQDTNLLAKSEFTSNNRIDPKTFQPRVTLEEYFFSNYKKLKGVNQWWKCEQHLNGTKAAEVEIQEVQFFDKLDNSLFSKPGDK